FYDAYSLSLSPPTHSRAECFLSCIKLTREGAHQSRCISSPLHTHTCTHTHTHTHIHTHVCTLTLRQTHTYAQTHILIHTHTQTHTHKHIHTHIHTHTHTNPHTHRWLFWPSVMSKGLRGLTLFLHSSRSLFS